MKFYFYLIILLFMIFIIYDGFNKTIKYAPNKIKLICSAIFIFLTLRYVCLIYMFFASNIAYLYFFKPAYFLNLIYIPLSILVAVYILIRNDKIKFLFMFFIAAILIGIYTYLIYNFPTRIAISSFDGYYMEFVNNNFVLVPFIILNLIILGLILAFCFNRLKKNGKVLLVLFSSLVIIEALLVLLGFSFFEHLIISDVIGSLTLNYSIGKLKKSVR